MMIWQSRLFHNREGTRPAGCVPFLISFRFSDRRSRGFLRAPTGRFCCAAFGGRDCQVPPRRVALDFPTGGRGDFFAPLQGAFVVPPSAAGIAGSRPGRRVHFLIAQEMDERRALKGGSLEEDGAQSSPPLRIPPPLTSSGVHKEGKYKPPKIKNGHLYRCPQSDFEKNFRFNMQCVADIKQRCNRKRHFNIGCLNMA